MLVKMIKAPDAGLILSNLAEREGFEPSKELIAPYSLSRRALSATQPPLRDMFSADGFYHTNHVRSTEYCPAVHPEKKTSLIPGG